RLPTDVDDLRHHLRMGGRAISPSRLCKRASRSTRLHGTLHPRTTPFVKSKRRTREALCTLPAAQAGCVRTGCARRKGWEGGPLGGSPRNDPSPRHRPLCDATDGRRREHMARLKKIVGLTLAVVLATALVAYMLRPSAAPTTSSTTTTKPPTDTTCGEHTRGMKEPTCGLPTGPTNGGGQGSNGDHDTDDHDDHGNHGGDSDDHDGGHGGHGDGGDHDSEGHGEHGGASDRGLGDNDDS